ncbi:MAG: ABC transporter permease [Actinomycetota bacterium]|nr:ABC transporter permease [Actinomycetota bacterium]
MASAEATAEPQGGKRSREDQAAGRGGAWFPRWYWPTFTLPGTLWLVLLFILPFYTVLSVAFGTVEPLFRTPLPVYQPWYWSFGTFDTTLEKFYVSPAIYQEPLIRTFAYVFAASAICLVVGYAVAYYTARYAGKFRVPILLMLVAPFFISYLMRIYAWQSLLQPGGYVDDIWGIFAEPVNWLSGKPVTVILGLVYGYIPFMILPLYGSLDRIEQSMLEAGRDLGASPFHTFRRVTLPLSKPAILAGLVIVSLPMFGDYYTNDLLGSQNTSMLGNLINLAVFQPGQGQEAGSLTIVLMLIVVIPMGYYLRETRRAAERA